MTSSLIVDYHQKVGQRRRWRNSTLALLGLIVLAGIWLIPMIWTLSVSFRPETSIQANLARIVPIPFTLENYQFVLAGSRLARWFGNSLVVAVVRTILQIGVCSLAAYAFARIQFPGRRFLFPLC